MKSKSCRLPTTMLDKPNHVLYLQAIEEVETCLVGLGVWNSSMVNDSEAQTLPNSVGQNNFDDAYF